jgi:hypothetical protein
MLACHVSVISANLRQISKAIESDFADDNVYRVLDNLIEDMWQRLDEIEFTLGIWDDKPGCNCKCCGDDDPWYQFDRKQPSDYKMD